MLPRYSGGVGAGDSGGSGGGLVSPSFVPGMSPSEVEAQRSSNMSLVTRGDPAWMQKFNFQVPPPPFYSVGPPQVNKPEPEEQQQQPQPPPPMQYSGATSASATAAVLDEDLEPQQPQPPPLHSQSFAPLVSAPLAIQGSPFVQQSPTVIEDPAIVQVSNVDQVKINCTLGKNRAIFHTYFLERKCPARNSDGSVPRLPAILRWAGDLSAVAFPWRRRRRLHSRGGGGRSLPDDSGGGGIAVALSLRAVHDPLRRAGVSLHDTTLRPGPAGRHRLLLPPAAVAFPPCGGGAAAAVPLPVTPRIASGDGRTRIRGDHRRGRERDEG